MLTFAKRAEKQIAPLVSRGFIWLDLQSKARSSGRIKMRPAVCLAVDASRVESKQAKDNQSGQLLAAQLIKTLLLALAAGQLQAASRGVEAAQLAPAPAPANATGKPLWHRPGCYQVGE